MLYILLLIYCFADTIGCMQLIIDCDCDCDYDYDCRRRIRKWVLWIDNCGLRSRLTCLALLKSVFTSKNSRRKNRNSPNESVVFRAEHHHWVFLLDKHLKHFDSQHIKWLHQYRYLRGKKSKRPSIAVIPRTASCERSPSMSALLIRGLRSCACHFPGFSRSAPSNTRTNELSRSKQGVRWLRSLPKIQTRRYVLTARSSRTLCEQWSSWKTIWSNLTAETAAIGRFIGCIWVMNDNEWQTLYFELNMPEKWP